MTNGPTGIPGQRGGVQGRRGLSIAAMDPVPLYRDGMTTMLQRTPGMRWAGHATSHHGCLQLCEQMRPDVVLVDSGLDPQCHLVRLLAGGDPALLIMVTVRESNRNARFLSLAMAAGAHAVVPRPIEAGRMLEAIRRAHADRRYIDPSLTALTARPKRQAPQAAPQSTDDGKQSMPLSRREYQVLQLVAEGLENSDIAQMLYLSVETVRTHVKSILRKLNVRDRTHAVTVSFRCGILSMRSDGAPGSTGDAANTHRALS